MLRLRSPSFVKPRRQRCEQLRCGITPHRSTFHTKGWQSATARHAGDCHFTGRTGANRRRICISEIVAAATGAKLREVGATNKTTLEDYANAVGPETAMILKVHRSNFFMSGFVESPSSNEISALAKKKRIPFVEDLGSGAMIATESLGIAEHEPTPGEVLKAGVDLVCFSGDKLFGGPQAGIIAGKKRFVAALKREPLFRALRCDKLCCLPPCKRL